MMCFRTVRLVSILGVVAVLALVGCAAETPAPTATQPPATTSPTTTPAATGGTTHVLRWMESDIIASSHMVTWNEMLAAMESSSGGRLKFEVYHLGEHPYQPQDSINVVRDGLADMYQTQGVDVSGLEPILGAMEVPFMIPDIDTAYRVFNRTRKEVYNPLLESKYNQFMLGGILMGGGSVHSNKFLNSFQDVKGQKIRVFNRISGLFVEVMGGVPATVEFPEIYGALDTGVLDGALTSMSGAYDGKWMEVVKYHTIWDYFFGADFILMNMDTFNGLPADLQALMLDMGESWARKNHEDYYAITLSNMGRAIMKYGSNIQKMDPSFRAAVKAGCESAIYDTWKASAGPQATVFLQIVAEESKA